MLGAGGGGVGTTYISINMRTRKCGLERERQRAHAGMAQRSESSRRSWDKQVLSEKKTDHELT